MSKTIAIIGSARRDGNTGKLIDSITENLGIEVIDLNIKEIAPFDYQFKNKGDDFLSTIEHILQHDNIIFASPVYWYAMSAQMKIFMDRLSDLLSVEELKELGRALRGKVGYVVSTSINETADDSFINSFIDSFGYLGITYGDAVHVNCRDGFNLINNQHKITDFIESVANS